MLETGLEFLEDGHIYRLGEKTIPSVSEIIRFVAREVYKETDKFAMDQAADRGTRVHRAAEEIDRTGRCDCDPDVVGYVRAYAKFREEHSVEWVAIEQPVLGFDEKYAGTIDRAGYIDDEPWMIDIKTTKRITGKHKLLYGIQLSFYAAAADNSHLDMDTPHMKLAILQLKEDGTYKFIPVPYDNALPVSCLMLHEAIEKTKRRHK